MFHLRIWRHLGRLPCVKKLLCCQAWEQRDNQLEESPVVPIHSITLDICRRCMVSLFPETYITGRTKYIKFYHSLMDNQVIFDCIRAGKCPCDREDPQNYFLQLILYPASAAAVAGNLDLLRHVAAPWVSCPQNTCTHQPDFDKVPSKSCLKKSSSPRMQTVSFLSQAEHFGESVVSDVLIHAIYGGNEKCIEFLLQNIMAKYLNPHEIISCLDMSLRVARPDLFLKMAIQFGINTNSLDDISTPLILAVQFGCTLMVCSLLSFGADPELRNGKGETALHAALKSDCKDAVLIVQMLISAISVENLDDDVMCLALHHCKFNVIKYLISQGICTAREPWTGHKKTPVYIPVLHWAVMYVISQDSAELVELLMSMGLDTTSQIGTWLQSPMHLAMNRTEHILDLLLKYNVSVNVYDSNGRTPLFQAIRDNKVKHFKSLVFAGSSLYCKINNNDPHVFQSNFSMALTIHQYQFAMFLLRAGYVLDQHEAQCLTERAEKLPIAAVLHMTDIRCQPLPLISLCAFSLREHFLDKINVYMSTVGCPQAVQRFVRLEHLADFYLSGQKSNWSI